MTDQEILDTIKTAYKNQMSKNQRAMAWGKIEVDGEEAWVAMADPKSASVFMHLLESVCEKNSETKRSKQAPKIIIN